MKKVYLFVILTAFCFGTLEISGKIAGNNLDAFQFTFWRFFIGSLCLIPITIQEQREFRERNRPRPNHRDNLHILLAGILCVPLSLLLCQIGITRCNASTASVILGSNAMFTMIFAHFIASERFTLRKGKLLFIALVGIVFLISPWNMQPGNTLPGCLLMLLGAITFGLYVVVGKVLGQRVGPITQACGSMFTGSIVMLIITIIDGRPVFEGIIPNILVVLYAGIVVTGGGYLFLFKAIKYSDASTGSIAFFLKIIIAPILSVIILHEVLSLNTYIGIGLVLISSFLNLRAGASATAAASASATAAASASAGAGASAGTKGENDL